MCAPEQFKEITNVIYNEHAYWEVSVNNPTLSNADTLGGSLSKIKIKNLCKMLSVSVVKYKIIEKKRWWKGN